MAGVEYFVVYPGVFTTMAKTWVHLNGGTKRLSSLPTSANASMLVMGVNHEMYDNSLEIFSKVSCNTNWLALLVKVIHGNFGIMEGLMTTVYTIIATQKTVDGPSGKLWQDDCRTAQNTIPASTDATKVSRSSKS
jgi:glyceraldehyde 3-phosphate dehydrogenase